MTKIAASHNLSSGVVIRGTRDGVSVILGDEEWDQLLEKLAERLHSTASFFKGGRITLDVGDRVLNKEQLHQLEQVFSHYDMGLYIILARSPRTRAAARAIDLRAADSSSSIPGEATLASDTAPSFVDQSGILESAQSDGLLVRRTVRSGQVIKHLGPVVVIGDVNSGAEVISGGDVVIWGRLRGVVHAGALGDDAAVVCALQMRPTQLRIGNHIARAPEERSSQGIAEQRSAVPEIAFVRDGAIVAEPWNAGMLEM